MSCRSCAKESSITFLTALGFAIYSEQVAGGMGTALGILSITWVVLSFLERYDEHKRERRESR